jgi:hypothetical protein
VRMPIPTPPIALRIQPSGELRFAHFSPNGAGRVRLSSGDCSAKLAGS